jgi:hypothetical protein
MLGEARLRFVFDGMRAPVALRQLEVTESELQNFENFVNMNYLAFSKILKKHDKCDATPKLLRRGGRKRWARLGALGSSHLPSHLPHGRTGGD